MSFCGIYPFRTRTAEELEAAILQRMEFVRADCERLDIQLKFVDMINEHDIARLFSASMDTIFRERKRCNIKPRIIGRNNYWTIREVALYTETRVYLCEGWGWVETSALSEVVPGMPSDFYRVV